MFFSAVVWMGDMNFRIRDFTREEVISKVQGNHIKNQVYCKDCFIIEGSVDEPTEVIRASWTGHIDR